MAYVQQSRHILRRIQNSDRVLHHPLFHSAQGIRYRKLNVILTTSVDKLGKPGDTVNVAAGYFRNYLMPNLYAVPNIDRYKHLIADQLKIYKPKEEGEVQKVYSKSEEDAMKEYQTAVKRLTSSKLVFRKFYKVDNEIREPVTTEEIVAAAAKQLLVQISPENVRLSTPLSSYGEYQVPLRLPKSIPLPEGKSQWTLTVKIRKR